MLTPALLVALVVTGQKPEIEPVHAGNAVYSALLEKGLTLDGTHVEFPAPALRDGEPAPQQREALVKIAGSTTRLDELLRDSVTAPFLLKVHDETTKEGDLIRRGDLFFVVHADLDAIKPDDVTRRGTEEKPVEAGNMRFVSHILTADELQSRGLKETTSGADHHEWFVHAEGRLLDRIQVDASDRITATHSPESWVFATRTEPKFDDDPKYPNRWRSLGGKSAFQRYAGGASYVKISKLAAPAGALFVEAHFTFDEPRAWFDGAPILRSKLSVISQDQIRRLRRELAQQKSKPKSQ